MSAREDLLCQARKVLWDAWSQSSEEIGSEAARTLMGLGMLVPQGGAAELERLRLLMNAQPVELTEAQRDALSDAGNRALNDHYHEDLCFCRDWPESCATSGYFPGMWDTGAFDIGLGAVLGLWESMREERPQSTGAELQSRELSAALAELETLRAQPSRDAVLEEVAVWLGKKAREYRGSSTRESAAEALERMADKIRRGAVRPPLPVRHRPTAGELAEQRHLVDPLDHAFEALALRTVHTRPIEDPHESPLHRPYAEPHDLPPRADLPESLR